MKMMIKLVLMLSLILLIIFNIEFKEPQKAKPIAYTSEGFIEELLIEEVAEEIQKVRFTSYHMNDGSSGDTTASGLKVSDFAVNENGWFTYRGKVVIAAATEHCTALKKGVCGKYNDLPSGFKQYNLFDEITMIVDDVEYSAIILDVCGASYWPEERQRYDIFVSAPKYAIDKKGEVYWFIDELADIDKAIWCDEDFDNFKLEKRNVYRTKAEAEKALEMYEFCKERSFKPNWKDENERKYYLCLDYDNKMVDYGIAEIVNGFESFHYPTREVVQEIIDKYSFEELEKYYGRV